MRWSSVWVKGVVVTAEYGAAAKFARLNQLTFAC